MYLESSRVIFVLFHVLEGWNIMLLSNTNSSVIGTLSSNIDLEHSFIYLFVSNNIIGCTGTELHADNRQIGA